MRYLPSCYLRASFCMLQAACFMLRLMSRALHFPVDWGCFCPCSAALCFLGAPGFMRFSQPLTRSLTVSCTQTHMLDKRVFWNTLSSVSIVLLSAFLRSAFHRHFIFLLQTPAYRRSFFSVSGVASFFWFRASIRFFNSMLISNSETLRRVLKTDLHLASFDSSCWSAQASLECVQWTAK